MKIELCSLEVTQSSNSRIVKYMTKTTQLYSNIKYPKSVQNRILALNLMVFSLQALVTILEEQKFQISEPKTKDFIF